LCKRPKPNPLGLPKLSILIIYVQWNAYQDVGSRTYLFIRQFRVFSPIYSTGKIGRVYVCVWREYVCESRGLVSPAYDLRGVCVDCPYRTSTKSGNYGFMGTRGKSNERRRRKNYTATTVCLWWIQRASVSARMRVYVVLCTGLLLTESE